MLWLLQTSHLVHCNVSFSLKRRFSFTTRNVVQFHPGHVCPFVYICKHPLVTANVRIAGLCYNKSNCNVGTVHTIHSLKEKKADLTVSYSHCFALALPLLSTESSSQCPVCRTCQCSVHSPGYSVRITSHSSQLPSTLPSYIMRMASLPADVFVTLCKSKNFSFDTQQS